MKQIFDGFFFLKRGMGCLKKYPGIKKLIIFPIIIDIFIVIGFFTFGFQSIGGWVTSALAFIESGSWIFDVIYYPLLILAWLAFSALALYLAFVVSSIVASPFNALIAERILKKNAIVSEDKFNFLSWSKLTVKMLVAAIVKAIIFSIIGIGLFIASFIPGLNILSSFGIFLIFAFDSFDYAFEVRGWTFRKRFSYFKANMPTASGMAGMFALTVFIPGLTILVLPLAVIGATDLMCELERR